MLLEHLFETRHAIRVQMRTHNANTQSKRAIQKLGFVLEGIIRNESIFSDGSLRDTALYSVVKDEWPQVKRLLQDRLNWDEDNPS